MTNEERLRLNVRAIRVTLASALRYAGEDEAEACVDRARQLLSGVRAQATSRSVISEIEAVQAELDRRGVQVIRREG